MRHRFAEGRCHASRMQDRYSVHAAPLHLQSVTNAQSNLTFEYVMINPQCPQAVRRPCRHALWARAAAQHDAAGSSAAMRQTVPAHSRSSEQKLQQVSRRDLGAISLAAGLASSVAAVSALLPATAAAAETLTAKDVTPAISPAGPLSAR